MKKRILILLMILLPLSLSAQEISKQITKTPDVAALAKYVDYPVSYATGVPDISIPLYTIKTKEFTLPISLSYHASGIKVTDLSGFVGLGWALSAEPTITRTVKGNYDEESNGYIANSFLGKSTSDNDYLQYMIYVTQGIWDEQPDIFYYKLLDKSGKFMFWKSNLSSTTATPIPMPYEPILISMNASKNFGITDDKGEKYSFSTGENFYSSTGGINHTNSWKVDKIVAAQNNDSLLFNYYTYANAYFLPEFGDEAVVEDEYSSGIENAILDEQAGINVEGEYYVDPTGKFNTCSDDECRNTYSPFGNNLIYTRPHNTVNSVCIKEILLPDGNKVSFNADTGTKLLNSINTPDGKTIHFYYSSFYEKAGSPVRARLDSVVFSDNQNVAIERYRFSYNGSTGSQSIPYPGFYDWRSTDYWGYYNGALIADSLCSVPKQTVTVQTSSPNLFSFTIGADTLLRAVNEENMKLWTLNEIEYPTGGKTTFGYEANRYLEPTSGQTVLIGGLRVNTIQNYDPVTGQTIVRNFSYDQPIYFPLSLDEFSYTQRKVINGDYNSSYSRIRTYLSSPVVNYSFNGSPVVYNKVTETRGDGATTEYYFDYSTGYLPFHISGTSVVIDNQKDWQFGDKILEIHYKPGSPNVPVLRKDYTYKIFYTGNEVYKRDWFHNTIFIPSSNETPTNRNVSISVYPNNILQGAKRISEEITTTYGNSSNTVVTKTYGYSNPNHLYPTQITTKNSQGDSIQSMMRYPGDMDAALAGMNIQYPVLEKTDWENGSLSQGHRTSYEYFPGRDRPRLYLPGEESEWNRTTSRFENKYIYDSYDFNANILQGHKANDDTSAVIWDYSTHLPVIIADNVTNAILQSAVLSSLPSGYSTLLQLLTAVDGIATNSRQQDLWNTFCRNMINNSVLSGSMLSLYTYKPYIGMTSSTDSKGTATYYEYDSFNRLKNVKNAQGQLLKRDLYHYSRNQ